MFTELLLRPRRHRPSYSSSGSIRVCRQLQMECLEERQLLAAPQIFLTSAVLASLQQQALANTAPWQAFQAKLNAGLAVVPGNAYQGSELQAIADYALGYQVLQTIAPVTAANYADKALALMKSALVDYQKDGSITRQFLARGNGITTTFTLPNANLIPSSLNVYLAPVTTQAVIHGSLGGQDSIGFYLKALKVSNTPDGNPDYLQGVDWFRNPNLSQDLIDWSLAGKEPAVGATYYVTSADSMYAPLSKFTLSGNTITLPTAPTTGQAVYVEYVYGTRSANYSTLAYQMTSAGDGGFNSVLIDSTYSYRYLGPFVAMGLDWLDSYPGFATTFKSQVINMLIRWSNYIRDFGYQTNSPASNYGDGDYEGRVMTALALLHRDPAGPGLITEVLNYRQNYVIPTLTNASPSLRGGYIEEGWSYGQNAAQHLLLGSLALEVAGQISAASAERQWASQAIYSLISAQPTPTTLYDGGDWYVFPSYFPDNTLFDVLAYMANDPTAQSYANYIIQTRPNKTKHVFLDLLFQNPSAPASFWGSYPLQYYSDGAGLVTARADWSYQSTWLAFQLSNLFQAGHQSYAPGQLQIQRGGDDLLANANAVGGNQNLATKSSFSNLIAINDNGAGLQDYPWNMGIWYGTPGVFISNYEATANYVYVGGDYQAAYSNDQNPGGGGPATQLTRQVVYLRPDFIIVHDRAGTLVATYSKQLQWHFLNAPTVTGNSWVETVGSSSLFGDTFSSVPLTTTTYPVVDAGATVYRVATNNTSPVLNVQYTTALETAPSSVTSMVSTRQVVSTNGVMEGVQEGGDLVLFGTNGPVNPLLGPIAYSVSGSGSVYNLLTDLQPGQAYQIHANGVVLATLTASAQGTISFTTAAGTTAVSVTTSGVGVGNPVPSLSTISPTTAVEGAGSLALSVTGTGFISASVVQWNGTPLTTTYVSSTQLTATVPAADLAEEGKGNITVANPAPGGGTSAAVSFTISDAALTASGVAVTATEGLSFSGQVATFTDANAAAPLTDFTTGSGGASINWGDGTSSAGTVTQPGGVGTQFVVNGSHTYSDQGSYTLTVAITDLGGSSKSVTASATVADAALTASGVAATATEGLSFSGQVATFTDANAAAPLTDFTTGSGGASINWGDGTSSAGTVTQPGGVGTQFVVNGSHTYSDQGSYTVTVTVTDLGGSTKSVTASATVADAALTASGSPITMKPGVLFSGQVATFTDANPSAPLSDFTTGSGGATIDWGDGTAKTTGTITQPGGVGTQFVVSGSHTYRMWGSFTVTVTITDAGGSTVTATTVAGNNPLPTISTLSQNSAVEGANSFVLTVTGTGFVSTSVVQWNGTPLATTFVSSTQLTATVPASDLAQEGSGKITVVNPPPGGGSSATVSFTVSDAKLSATAAAISASPGVPFSGTVATFTDANATAPLADFTTGSGGAAINWGDGTPNSSGTITQPAGVGTQFVVSGSHTYSAAGSYTVTVTISDAGGSTVTVTTTASAVAASAKKDEIVGRVQTTGQWWVSTSTGTSFVNSLWGTWDPSVTWLDVHSGSFVGDGKTEIAGRNAHTGQWWVAANNGPAGFTTTPWTTWSNAVAWVDVQVGDFNGDGKADLIGRVEGTGQWWVSLSTGSSFTSTLWAYWSSSVTWVDAQVGDFNGDGKSDIAARALETGQWWVGLSTGSSFNSGIWSTWSTAVTWVDVKVGDFNGDGKSDITGRVLQTGQWWTSLSTGSGFQTTLWDTWSPAVTWVDVHVGDFNGGGKADLVGRVLETGEWWVGLSTGTSFAHSYWATWDPSATWVDVRIGDFNGDGMADITGRNSQTGAWWTGLSTGSSFKSTVWGTWNPSVIWVDVQKGVFV